MRAMRLIRLCPAICAGLLAFSLPSPASLASSPAQDHGTRKEAVSRFNACAQKMVGHCDFYSRCLEASFPCGEQSYAIAFGQRYCDKFDQDYGSSQYLAGFVGKTRSTLQRQLVAYINRHQGIRSCEQLEDFAFSSHSTAYIAQPFGICHLFDLHDLKTIITTIDEKDLLLRPKLWRSSLQVASHCVKTLFWPLTRTSRLLLP